MCTTELGHICFENIPSHLKFPSNCLWSILVPSLDHSDLLYPSLLFGTTLVLTL